jgi:hypothetical protein
MNGNHDVNYCNKNIWMNWVPVAHACNPSYLEDRDQKDHSSRHYLKSWPIQKKVGRVAQVVERLPKQAWGPQFKPLSTTKKKKKKLGDLS